MMMDRRTADSQRPQRLTCSADREAIKPRTELGTQLLELRPVERFTIVGGQSDDVLSRSI
jgi:hypothetical protein